MLSTRVFLCIVLLFIVALSHVVTSFEITPDCIDCDDDNHQVCGVTLEGELISEPFKNSCDLIAHMAFQAPNAFPINGKCEICAEEFPVPKCALVDSVLRLTPIESKCEWDRLQAAEAPTAIIDIDAWTCRPCSSDKFDPVCVKDEHGVLQPYYFTDECSIAAIDGVIEPKALIKGKKCYIPDNGNPLPSLCDDTKYPEPKCARVIATNTLIVDPVVDDCQLEVLEAKTTDSAYIVNGKCVDNKDPCTKDPVCGIHNGVVRATAFNGDCDAKSQGYNVALPSEATIKGTNCYQCGKKDICIRSNQTLVLMDECRTKVNGLTEATPVTPGNKIVIFGSSSECRECDVTLKNKCAQTPSGQIEPVKDQCEAFNQGWELTTGYRYNKAGACVACDESDIVKKCALVNNVLTPLDNCQRVELGVSVESNAVYAHETCHTCQADGAKVCGRTSNGELSPVPFANTCELIATDHVQAGTNVYLDTDANRCVQCDDKNAVCGAKNGKVVAAKYSSECTMLADKAVFADADNTVVNSENKCVTCNKNSGNVCGRKETDLKKFSSECDRIANFYTETGDDVVIDPVSGLCVPCSRTTELQCATKSTTIVKVPYVNECSRILDGAVRVTDGSVVIKKSTAECTQCRSTIQPTCMNLNGQLIVTPYTDECKQYTDGAEVNTKVNIRNGKCDERECNGIPRCAQHKVTKKCDVFADFCDAQDNTNYSLVDNSVARVYNGRCVDCSSEFACTSDLKYMAVCTALDQQKSFANPATTVRVLQTANCKTCDPQKNVCVSNNGTPQKLTECSAFQQGLSHVTDSDFTDSGCIFCKKSVDTPICAVKNGAMLTFRSECEFIKSGAVRATDFYMKGDVCVACDSTPGKVCGTSDNGKTLVLYVSECAMKRSGATLPSLEDGVLTTVTPDNKCVYCGGNPDRQCGKDDQGNVHSSVFPTTCARMAAGFKRVDLNADSVVLIGDVCHKCPSGYTKEDNKCIKGESCAGKLHKETVLTSDANGFDYVRTCVLKCPDTHPRVEGEKCIKCIAGDELCITNSQQCPERYVPVDTTPDVNDPVLVQRKCALNCQNGYVAEGETCVKKVQCADYLVVKRIASQINNWHVDETCVCKDGYVLKGGYFWSTDTYCYAGEETCSEPHHVVEVVYVDNNPNVRRGACVLKCPDPYIRMSNHCYKGPAECPQLSPTSQATYTLITIDNSNDQWLSEHKCQLNCTLPDYEVKNQYDIQNGYCEQKDPVCFAPKKITSTASGLLRPKRCVCPDGFKETTSKMEAMLSGDFWSFVSFETGEVVQNYNGAFGNHKLTIGSDNAIYVALSGGRNTYAIKVLRSRTETPYQIATCGPNGQSLALTTEARAQGWTIRAGVPQANGIIWNYIVPPKSYLTSRCIKGDDEHDCTAKGSFYNIKTSLNTDGTFTNTCVFECTAGLKKLSGLNKCLDGPDQCKRHQKESVSEADNKVIRVCIADCADGYTPDDVNALCVRNLTCPPSYDGITYGYEGQVDDFVVTNYCVIVCPSGFTPIRNGTDIGNHYCIQKATCQSPRKVQTPTSGVKRVETCICPAPLQSYNDTVKCYGQTDNFRCEPTAYFDRSEVLQGDGSYKVSCSFKCPRGTRVPNQNKCIIGNPCAVYQLEQLKDQNTFDIIRTCVDNCDPGFVVDSTNNICVQKNTCPFQGTVDGISWYYERVIKNGFNVVDECRLNCPAQYTAINNSNATLAYCIKKVNCPAPFVVRAPDAVGFKREETCVCPPGADLRRGSCFTGPDQCLDANYFVRTEVQDTQTKLYSVKCDFTCAKLAGSTQVPAQQQCIDGPTTCPPYQEVVVVSVSEYHVQRQCKPRCAAGFIADDVLMKCIKKQPCPANTNQVTYANNVTLVDPIDEWQGQYRCQIQCPTGWIAVHNIDVTKSYCIVPKTCTSPQTPLTVGDGVVRNQQCQCPAGTRLDGDKCFSADAQPCPDPEFFDQTPVRNPQTGLYTYSCQFVCRGDRRRLDGQQRCRQGPETCGRQEVLTIKSDNQYLETASCSSNCPPGYISDNVNQLCIFVETCPAAQPNLGISYGYVDAPNPNNVWTIIKKCVLVCRDGVAIQAADVTQAYCRVTPNCPAPQSVQYPPGGIVRSGVCTCPNGTYPVQKPDGSYCYTNPDFNCPADDTYGFFVKKSIILADKTRTYACDFSCPTGLTQMQGQNICIEGDLTCDGDHLLLQTTKVNAYYLKNKCVSSCTGTYVPDYTLKKCVKVETCPAPENGVTYGYKLVTVDSTRVNKVCTIQCQNGTVARENVDITLAFCEAPPPVPCTSPMSEVVPTTGKLRVKFCRCPDGLELWRDKCYTPGDKNCPSEQFFIRREVVNADNSITVKCDFSCAAPRRVYDASAQLCIEGPESCPAYKVESVVNAGQYLRRRECSDNCPGGYLADDNIGRCVKIEQCPAPQRNVTYSLVRVDQEGLLTLKKCKIVCPIGYIADESSSEITKQFCHAQTSICYGNELMIKVFSEDQGVLRDGVCTCVAGYQTKEDKCIKGETECPNTTYFKLNFERVAQFAQVYYVGKCDFFCPAGLYSVPGENACVDKPGCDAGYLAQDTQDPNDPYLRHKECVLDCKPPLIKNGAYCLNDTTCPDGQIKTTVVSSTDSTKMYAYCKCPDGQVLAKVGTSSSGATVSICVPAPICQLNTDIKPFAVFLEELKEREKSKYSPVSTVF
jgi:hypothetical protein